MKRKFKYIFVTASCLTLPVMIAAAQDPAAAATAAEAAKPAVPELFYNPSFYLVSFVFIIMFAAIVSLTRTIRTLAIAMLPEDKKKAISAARAQAAVAESEAPSFWTRFDRNVLTKAVPVEREADVMLDHDYDGIKELDNSLPPWWVWGFYLTIFWAVVYLVHYHVMDTGPLQIAEYNNEVAMADQQLKERQAKMTDLVTAENVVALNTPEGLGSGKDLFTKNCLACHGANGEGTVGPNLTDEYWIHGGGIKNIFRTVTDGVPAKGMISWKAQLTPKQIQQVSSYILTLQGTKPANGKEPQGDKWVDESAAPAPADSTAKVPADSVTKATDVATK